MTTKRTTYPAGLELELGDYEAIAYIAEDPARSDRVKVVIEIDNLTEDDADDLMCSLSYEYYDTHRETP